MSGIMRAFEETQERGYNLDASKTVCSNCFDEYGIKQFIKENPTQSSCSYCHEDEDEEVVSCKLDLLIGHIIESIDHEWGNPSSEGLPYETREGGWQVSAVYDTWDLLRNLALQEKHDAVFKDIYDAILNTEWCEKDPYSLSIDKSLLLGWQKFSEFVKNKARYVFFRAENSEYDKDQHDEIDPISILDTLESIINENDFVKEINTDIQIRRVRIVDTDEALSSAKDLGSPPREFATMANRMSPVGIPMFYGAFDNDTAIKETFDDCEIDKKAMIGVFVPIRPLFVIDISDKLPVPSLFDGHKRNRRDGLSFLYAFVDDFSKPIERSDRAHVEYVPTQVVTEFFRYLFKDKNKRRIDGVIYPSTRNKGEKAIVIFADSDQCVELSEASVEGAIWFALG